MDDKEKKRVPFDREYSTSYKNEEKWLLAHGIRYTFVKEVNTITTYKYKKNSELFGCLYEFYKQLEENAETKDKEDKD